MSTPLHPLSEMSKSGGTATPEAYDRTCRRSRVIDQDFDIFWNRMTAELVQTERHFDEIKYREALRNGRYYEGHFFWRFSDEDHSIRDLPHTDEDPFFPENWFQYYCDLSIAAAMEAQPDIIVDPASKDEKDIRTARACDQLLDNLERNLLTEDFRLDSEKYRQLESGIWWYSYFSPEAGSLYIDQPIYKDSPRKIDTGTESAFICGCGNMGPVNRLLQSGAGAGCPQCHRSDRLIIIQSGEAAIDEIESYERVKAGFPVVEPVSSLQMHGDRRGGKYLRGTWLCRTRLLDKDTVAERIPWWDPDKGGGGTSDDPAVRAQELARRPIPIHGPVSGTPGSADRGNNDVVVQQWWLQPAKYAHIEFSKPVTFVGENSTTIPANTRLGEVFPKGMYRLKVGSEWLDHREEDFRKHWVYIPYVQLTHKADGGTTISTMAEPQQKINKVGSLLYLYLLSRAGGAPTIIMAPLSETDFDGSPATITRIPHGSIDDIRKTFFQPEFPPPDPSLMNYVTRMTGQMQVQAQVVSPNTTGDPAAMEMGGTETARGMMIMNAKSQGLQGPKLMPLAFGQATAARQWIELCRDNFPDEVPIPLKGNASGAPEWAMISGADLEGDIVVYPRPGSWIPHPREEQQAALQNAFTTFGQILLDPNASADLKRAIKEAYKLDMNLDSEEALEERDAAMKIETMEQMLPDIKDMLEQVSAMTNLMSPPVDPSTPMSQAPQDPNTPLDPNAQSPESPDPEQAQLQQAGQMLVKIVAPDEKRDNPTVYLAYLTKWLKGERARQADPMLKAGVEALWDAYSAIAQQQQEQQLAQAAKQQAGMASAIEDAKAQAKTKGDIALEQERQKGKMQVEQVKGKASIVGAALQSNGQGEQQQIPEPQEQDTAIRDHYLDLHRTEQEYKLKEQSENRSHEQRMREMMAKGSMETERDLRNAALQPPQMPGQGNGQLSIAGENGAIASGHRMVPALPDLPAQAAM